MAGNGSAGSRDEHAGGEDVMAQREERGDWAA